MNARLSFALLLFAGCAKPPIERPPPPPAPVTVATAARKTMPVQVRALGTVKALATVAVRVRVTGELTGVHFKEGEYVSKGQKLFTIDPSQSAAAVKVAEAELARSRATLKGAESSLKLKVGAGNFGVSAAELELARTAVATAKAAVAAGVEAVATAQLQIGFATISSPLEGRTGELLVNRGNLVDASGATPLVVVNQISPIAVSFPLPESQLPAVVAALRRGPVSVAARLRDEPTPIPGTLAFIDNAVNTGSGTVLLKAEYPNADRSLWPGEFVDVVVTVREQPDCVVVPTTAVQVGQVGSFVYIVTGAVAELRPVTVAFEVGDEAVVSSGLRGGETVVTDGHLRLVSGAKVAVKSNDPVAAK